MAEKKQSFEENLKNLEDIVEQFENGEVSLDEAMKLAKLCDESLKKAEDNMNLILKDGELKEFKEEE